MKWGIWLFGTCGGADLFCSLVKGNGLSNDPYAGQYYGAIMTKYAAPLDGLNVQMPQALAQRAYQSAS
jgi:hypothetical protein